MPSVSNIDTHIMRECMGKLVRISKVIRGLIFDLKCYFESSLYWVLPKFNDELPLHLFIIRW